MRQIQIETETPRTTTLSGTLPETQTQITPIQESPEENTVAEQQIDQFFTGGSTLSQKPEDIRLAIAAMQALSQIGNQKDLKIVEALSEAVAPEK